MKLRIMLITILLFCAAVGRAEINIDELPRYKSVVNDYGEILSYNHKLKLTKYAQALYYEAEVEFALLTINALDEGSVDEYAAHIFNEWHLGHRTKEKGILLLVVVAEEETRIQVGYGLEEILPDSITHAIILSMDPFMKREWYGQATYRGGLQIINQIAHAYNIKLADFPEIDPITAETQKQVFDLHIDHLAIGAGILVAIIIMLRVIKFLRFRKGFKYQGFWSNGYRGGFISGGLCSGFNSFGGGPGSSKRW